MSAGSPVRDRSAQIILSRTLRPGESFNYDGGILYGWRFKKAKRSKALKSGDKGWSRECSVGVPCVGNDADAFAPEQVEPPKSYLLGDLSIDFTHRRGMVAGRDMSLKAIRYDLLANLAVNARAW